jgi:hypothetical protein
MMLSQIGQIAVTVSDVSKAAMSASRGLNAALSAIVIFVAACATTPRTAEVLKACGLEQHDGWRVLRNPPADAGVILSDLQSDTPFKRDPTAGKVDAYWLQAEAGNRLAYCELGNPLFGKCGASVAVSTTLRRREGTWKQEGDAMLSICSR